MKISKTNKKRLFLLIFLGIFGISSISFALNLNWPKSPGQTKLTDDSTLPQLIQYLYEWGIALGGLAVFTALISAGLQYLGSAGDIGKMGDARKKIGSAVMGLILLLSSWLILDTINPELTTFQPLSFDISDLPPVVGGDFTSAPSCEMVKLYKEINWRSPFDTVLSADKTVMDWGTGPYPKSAKAFYTKPSNEKHCNYGLIVGIDCVGEVTCDIGTTICESGPTGGGCMLKLAAGGLVGLGCGDVIAYVPATDTDFTDWVDKSAKCTRLIFPR